MVAVWVVVVVLVLGVGAVALATRRHHDDVEPSVREFTEFRDAISRQVAGVQTDTKSTQGHLDHPPAPAGLPGGLSTGTGASAKRTPATPNS